MCLATLSGVSYETREVFRSWCVFLEVLIHVVPDECRSLCVIKMRWIHDTSGRSRVFRYRDQRIVRSSFVVGFLLSLHAASSTDCPSFECLNCFTRVAYTRLLRWSGGLMSREVLFQSPQTLDLNRARRAATISVVVKTAGKNWLFKCAPQLIDEKNRIYSNREE